MDTAARREYKIRKQDSGSILPHTASASPSVPILVGAAIAAGGCKSGSILSCIASASPLVSVLNGGAIAIAGCKSKDVEKVFVLDLVEGAGQHMKQTNGLGQPAVWEDL